MNLYTILCEIEIAKGKEKQNVLQKYKDNQDFTDILVLAYNDNKYGFSKNKLRKELDKYKEYNSNFHSYWDNGFDMCEALATSNINNQLRDAVYSTLSAMSEDLQEVWIRVLTKDLKCGISVTSINKAIPNLIPVWTIQKASTYKEGKIKDGTWIGITLKENGIHGTYYDGIIKSRQNKVFEGLDHIINEINILLQYFPYYVFEGELIRDNIDNLLDNENFRLTTSILSDETADKTPIKLDLFDLLPQKEFDLAGVSTRTYKERLEQLKQIQSLINELGLKYIGVCEILYEGTDVSQIQKQLDIVDSKGLEGCVVSLDKYYQRKRLTTLFKVKSWKDADCKIIGYEEGTIGSKYEGMLGAFIIDYKGNKVSVGGGYSDEQRQEMWDNRDKYMGKILQVKFKEETKNKETGLVSLQFGTFVCIREEGKEVSYE
jgi:DNA ligase-1|nr:MAG TPA: THERMOSTABLE DNA LIGASE [Caudoviricetes sp.]